MVWAYFGGPALFVLSALFVLILILGAYITWRASTAPCFTGLIQPKWLPDSFALFFLSATAYLISVLGIMISYPMIAPAQRFTLLIFFVLGGALLLAWEVVSYLYCGLATGTFILVLSIAVNLIMTLYLARISTQAAVLQIPYLIWLGFLLIVTGTTSIDNSTNEIADLIPVTGDKTVEELMTEPEFSVLLRPLVS